MVEATSVKEGMVLKIDSQPMKILSYEVSGTGKFGRTVHLRLKNLQNGHLIEKRFRAEERLEDIDTQTLNMEYLYPDGESLIFMNPISFDQISIPKTAIGNAVHYIKENMQVQVLLVEGKPMNVDFPKIAEIRVANTPSGSSETESTFKEAVLENGIETRVPQFIKSGDIIRIEVETNKYVDRVKEKKPEK